MARYFHWQVPDKLTRKTHHVEVELHRGAVELWRCDCGVMPTPLMIGKFDQPAPCRHIAFVMAVNCGPSKKLAPMTVEG